MTVNQIDKLLRLKKAAEKYDLRVRNTVNYARRCGRILIRIKKIVGHGHFQEWIEKNLKQIAYSTVAEYMYLSKNWQNPALKKLRKGKGDGLNSIRRMLDIIRNSQAENNNKRTNEKRKNKRLYYGGSGIYYDSYYCS
mgnify:CR=1 FL=1